MGITHPAALENVIGERKTSVRTKTPQKASSEPGNVSPVSITVKSHLDVIKTITGVECGKKGDSRLIEV